MQMKIYEMDFCMKEKIKKINDKFNNFGNLIYKYRYQICIAVFIVLVIFGLNGSSISMWNSFINTGVQEDNVIFGKSRRVRADEWATFTPMMFSQKFDGFHWFSNILCGGNTDVFMIYALPVFNLMQIFRPFQIGFIFLDISRGLSFYWMGRIVFLFLVSFEFGMLISKRKKLLALTYAFLVTFSPMVQWWFAINGTVEIIFFAELAILLLDKYLLDDNFIHRAWCLFGIIVSAGGFILVLYPAWQIPTAWAFVFIAAWVFIKNFKNVKLTRKDVVSIAIALIIFIICMTYVVYRSFDTLKAIINSVYPGEREEYGGDVYYPLLKWAMNIFLPYKDVLLKLPTSESATMFTMFPLGLILAIRNLIVNKEKDKCTICLLLADAFLLGYSIIGFPKVLAKITMLSRTTGVRAYFGIGVLDMILLIRSLAVNEKKPNIFFAITFATVSAIIIAYLVKKGEYQYITKKMFIAMVIMIFYLYYFAIRIQGQSSKVLFSAGVIFVMIMSGFMVNPIRVGANDVLYSPILNKAREINEKENGIWLVADVPYPIPEYFMMAGVPLINSTSTYPHLDRWQLFDDNGKYEDIYNRYAHIRVYIKQSEDEFVHELDPSKKDKFELIQNDVFSVFVLPDELKKMGVNYIFSIQNLEEISTENTIFNKLEEVNGYKFYKVEYN